MRSAPLSVLLWLLLMTGCSASGVRTPTTISNNAVASAGGVAYSFGGITDPAETSTATPRSFAVGESVRTISDLPGPPRIGASAIEIAGLIYVAGGYIINDDGSETTEPHLYRFDPAGETWSNLGRVPVEVDDTAMGSFDDRWLYLFSGWHGPAHANVRNVQVYDIPNATWAQAAPIPTPAVFGHVAGVVRTDTGPLAIVADGVKIVPDGDGRKFVISDAVCFGSIDEEDPTRITWTTGEPHPGTPTYRAASAVDAAGDVGQFIVVNGSGVAYNIDGVGYDSTPAMPLDQTLIWQSGRWTARPTGFASMDHRGLVRLGGAWAVIGGMDSPKSATDRVRMVDTLNQ